LFSLHDKSEISKESEREAELRDSNLSWPYSDFGFSADFS